MIYVEESCISERGLMVGYVKTGNVRIIGKWERGKW